MEDTLWVLQEDVAAGQEYSLNPCFNGRYSLSAKSVKNLKVKGGLNPCFNGRYSLSYGVCLHLR